MFACAFKGIKAKLSPICEKQAENVCSAVFLFKNGIFLTANIKGHRRGHFVSMQRK